jgi:hypothetical protein
MKMFWKTQDRAIDKLLGAQPSRQNAPARICREFDPDLANAYVEHSLTATEATRYELHLSECAPCRKVALARMAEADTSAPRAEVKSLSLAGGPQTGVKRLLGALTAPQWAMAAAAVIVIAISLPVLLSRDRSQPSPVASATENAAAQSSPRPAPAANPQTVETPGAAASSHGQAEAPSDVNAKSKAEKEQAHSENNVIAKADAPSAEASPGGVTGGAVSSPPPPTEPAQPKPDSAVADQVASKTTEQAQPAASVPAPATRQAEPELAKVDPDDARKLPSSKDSAQVTPLSPSRDAGEETKKQEATITDKQNYAPPPRPSSGPDVERREITGAGTGARFRARESARGVAERKVGGRKFWLRGDVWTDKDYNPDKEMPFVTVFRDSDVYRELLAKHSGMKPFLTGFAENVTVIFVYKGTVYKLVPQEGSK